MGSYDSPDYPGSPSIGIPGRDAMQSAPGSEPSALPETSAPLSDRVQQGTVGNSAVVYGAYDSLVTAQVVEVGNLDTLIPREADLYSGTDPNPLSGVPGAAVGSTGAGKGSVSSPHHPNNMSGGAS